MNLREETIKAGRNIANAPKRPNHHREVSAMNNVIDHDRLARITALAHGAHAPPNGRFEACAMEAVAYIAGEPWSDHPQCACPVISAFMRSWNDDLPDAERTVLLLPLVPKLVGTRKTKAVEKRRSLMAADWLVRVNVPAWLRLAGLTVHADVLAALPEITSMKQMPLISGPIEEARVDAAAAWAAARNAAWDAAGTAAGAAAWAAAAWAAAAWDAAWDAARNAAWDAAWDAAGAAARAAAISKLAATKAELQQSAVTLIERMIAA